MDATPQTAADLWQEMTDEKRKGFDPYYVLIGDDVWRKDDVPTCFACGGHDFDLIADDEDSGEGEMRCEPCRREYLGEVADDRSLHAWATHVRGV